MRTGLQESTSPKSQPQKSRCGIDLLVKVVLDNECNELVSDSDRGKHQDVQDAAKGEDQFKEEEEAKAVAGTQRATPPDSNRHSERDAWYVMFGALVEFKSKHGHFDVPSGPEDVRVDAGEGQGQESAYSSLSKWKEDQKRLLGRFEMGTPNLMSSVQLQRIQLLSQVGFKSDKNPPSEALRSPGQLDEWDRAFLQKVAPVVSPNRKESVTVTAGQWLRDQRSSLTDAANAKEKSGDIFEAMTARFRANLLKACAEIEEEIPKKRKRSRGGEGGNHRKRQR